MPKRFLLIDAGNSHLKAAIYENGTSIQIRRFQNAELNTAKEVLMNEDFDAVMVSSTSVDETLFETWFPGMKIHFLKADQFPEIRWAYSNPDSIGKDRVAAVIGAIKLHPQKNVCVADAGTCLTLDFITKEKLHLGGIISPGLKMRFTAMHSHTGKLPLVSEDDFTGQMGSSTESCMAAGAVFGIISEIEYHLEMQSKQQNAQFDLILTGGDANYLAQRIKPANFVVSDIVFQGMNAALASLV